MIITSNPLFWDSNTEPLILKNRVMETHDTANFFFQAPSLTKFQFKPGQFVTLKVEVDGKIYGRSYSIASLPNQDTIQLTVKRVSGGVVSNWLIDHLQPSQKLWTYGIAGDFNAIDHISQNKVLLMSSGCGIAPIMSITEHLIYAQNSHIQDILFIYRAVDARSIIFLDKIIALQKQYPHFKAAIFLKEGDSEKVLPESLPHIVGTLTHDHLQNICPDYKERSVFLCGTSSFMASTKRLLESSGFDMQHFHQESFTPTSLTGQPTPICVDNEEVFTVKAPKYGFENKEVEKEATLIDVLLEGDLPIVGACYSGLCGSCMCKVKSGQVESSSTGPLNQRQIQEGYVLACCSTIVGDVEVDF
ncbi:MAG: flavin reductase family protein [Saezia sp.]